PDPCGSGLARDNGLSVRNYLADTPQSRASPLPQGSGAVRQVAIRHAPCSTATEANGPCETSATEWPVVRQRELNQAPVVNDCMFLSGGNAPWTILFRSSLTPSRPPTAST
ncbi:hypothetical protein FEM54_15795, partial [Pseudomonas edaphica]